MVDLHRQGEEGRVVRVSRGVVEIGEDRSDAEHHCGEAMESLLARLVLKPQQLRRLLRLPSVSQVDRLSFHLGIVLLVVGQERVLQNTGWQSEERHREDAANANQRPREEGFVYIRQRMFFQQVDHDVPHRGRNRVEPLPLEVVRFEHRLAVVAIRNEVESTHNKPNDQPEDTGHQEQLAVVRDHVLGPLHSHSSTGPLQHLHAAGQEKPQQVHVVLSRGHAVNGDDQGNHLQHHEDIAQQVPWGSSDAKVVPVGMRVYDPQAQQGDNAEQHHRHCLHPLPRMVQRVADADVLLVQQRFGAHGVGVEVQQAQHNNRGVDAGAGHPIAPELVHDHCRSAGGLLGLRLPRGFRGRQVLGHRHIDHEQGDEPREHAEPAHLHKDILALCKALVFAGFILLLLFLLTFLLLTFAFALRILGLQGHSLHSLGLSPRPALRFGFGGQLHG
mmetsp:Transcript_85452/g.204788  ORF Transcript_85452/g.204788 Transcript_85452/m.204788 type:complete len:444 (-) Transcript_85452:227-1558(-)